MIRLRDTAFPTSAAFLAQAISVAESYGFEPLDELPRAKHSDRRALPPGARPDSDILFARKDEKILVSAAKRILASQPSATGALLAWRSVPLPSGAGISFELHAAGISGSIAEALLVVAGQAILKDAAGATRILAVNNMGSAESSGRYVRDVAAYLRKHLESIAPQLRPRVAADPLGALVQLIERGHPATSRAPQAMEYLTEEERRRFWDLLEYVEVFGLPYELNTQILGSRDCWTHALYELLVVDRESGEREAAGFGGRYDALMSRLARAPYPAATLSIQVESKGATIPKRQVRGVPSMYFAHLGMEARRRSLPLLEQLREAGIHVHHGIWHERIAEQIAAARSLAVPYILIMGHKEAVEGTVLVREVATNSQEAVALPDLPNYLKRRRLSRTVAETGRS